MVCFRLDCRLDMTQTRQMKNVLKDVSFTRTFCSLINSVVQIQQLCSLCFCWLIYFCDPFNISQPVLETVCSLTDSYKDIITDIFLCWLKIKKICAKHWIPLKKTSTQMKHFSKTSTRFIETEIYHIVYDIACKSKPYDFVLIFLIWEHNHAAICAFISSVNHKHLWLIKVSYLVRCVRNAIRAMTLITGRVLLEKRCQRKWCQTNAFLWKKGCGKN